MRIASQRGLLGGVGLMNETLKLQISAYVDGELSETESELLVRRMSQDPALRELANAYMGIGRALRGDPRWPSADSLRERVAKAIGTENAAPASVPELPAANNRFLRPLSGVAIAAGVAVLAIFGLQQVGPANGPATPVASNDLAALAIDEAPLYTEPPVADFVADRPSATLAQYYQQHNERAANLGGGGIFTRLVELELRGGELIPPEAASSDGAAAPATTEDRR